ncbi:MAG: DUF2197 domain-containing protein [Clostridiales bacterium]|nr:DUF2197 domain-containing protein [Clostridiales bacterium]
MEVLCPVCGRKETIDKTHKDFQKLAKAQTKTHICESCNLKIKAQAASANDLLR